MQSRALVCLASVLALWGGSGWALLGCTAGVSSEAHPGAGLKGSHLLQANPWGLPWSEGHPDELVRGLEGLDDEALDGVAQAVSDGLEQAVADRRIMMVTQARHTVGLIRDARRYFNTPGERFVPRPGGDPWVRVSASRADSVEPCLNVDMEVWMLAEEPSDWVSYSEPPWHNRGLVVCLAVDGDTPAQTLDTDVRHLGDTDELVVARKLGTLRKSIREWIHTLRKVWDQKDLFRQRGLYYASLAAGAAFVAGGSMEFSNQAWHTGKGEGAKGTAYAFLGLIGYAVFDMFSDDGRRFARDSTAWFTLLGEESESTDQDPSDTQD